jgi:hypothetical protein
MAASLLLTRGLGGGLGTMSTISGAQTAGLQYAETYGQLREEGKTHAQAWIATAPFALASGLATTFLTAAGGPRILEKPPAQRAQARSRRHPPGATRRALQPDDVRARHQSRRRPRQGRG